MKSEWQRICLYDLAKWKNGLPFREIQFSPRGKPVIKIAELKNGIAGQTKFTEQVFDKDVHVSTGDMLFSWSGNPETSIDVFWWDGPDGWLNQHIFKIQTNSNVDKLFFFYILKFLKPVFTATATNKQTTGLGHVTIRDLKDLYIYLPPLPEQRAIARILGSLDDKIELNRRMNATLELLAQTLFRAWFVDFEPVKAKAAGLAPVGLDAETAALFPSEFENSKLGPIPRGWEIGEFSDIADVRGGKQLHASQITSVGSIPVFGGNGIMGYTTNSNAPSFSINFGRVGAYCGNFYWSYEPCWINNNASFVARKNENIFCFLLHSLREIDINTIKRGAAQPFVSNGDIASQKLVIPSDAVVKKFEEICRPIFEKIGLDNKNSQSLAQIRDALLPRLISGQLRVPDADSTHQLLSD